MARHLVRQEQVAALLVHLSRSGKVIAPHKKGAKSFTFQEMGDPAAVVLDYSRTIVPLKKFFLPAREKLLSFDLVKNQYEVPSVESPQRIFVGVHSYDLQGLTRLDQAFLKGVPEANYLGRRENCLFVGVGYQPDKYHFSRSVGIPVNKTEGFDLFLHKVDAGYVVEELTEAGAGLMAGAGFPAADGHKGVDEPSFTNNLRVHYNRLPDLFAKAYDSKVWGEVSKRCVGCGSCNLVCPTCYCFDVKDEVAVNAAGGERVRLWDACMSEPFAAVAGGENFREHLFSRQRHRLYRKFKYQAGGTDVPFCVGCGRCAEQCTAHIDVTEIVNELYREQSGEEIRKSGN